MEGKGRLPADSECGGGDRPPTRINTRRNRNHRPTERDGERKREREMERDGDREKERVRGGGGKGRGERRIPGTKGEKERSDEKRAVSRGGAGVTIR